MFILYEKLNLSPTVVMQSIALGNVILETCNSFYFVRISLNINTFEIKTH